MEKITRAAFQYLEPSPADDGRHFAECATCHFWCGEGRQRCYLHGPAEAIDGDDTCTYYLPGGPTPAFAGKELSLVSPAQSGLTRDRRPRCENCTSFDAARSRCLFYEGLNRRWPAKCDLDAAVKPHACCDAQTSADRPRAGHSGGALARLEATFAGPADGRWGGGPRPDAGPEVAPLGPAEEAAVRRLLGRAAEPAELARAAGCQPGGRAEVTADGGGLRVRVSGDGYRATRDLATDADGNLHVANAGCAITRRGRGLATRMLTTQAEAAARLGARYIAAHAHGHRDGPDAYHNLARLGFDGPVPEQARASLPGPHGRAGTVHELLHHPDGHAAWKHHGHSFDGRFDLAPGSASLRILREVEEERKKSGHAAFDGPDQYGHRDADNPGPGYAERGPEHCPLDFEEDQAVARVWARRQKSLPANYPTHPVAPAPQSGATDGSTPAVVPTQALGGQGTPYGSTPPGAGMSLAEDFPGEDDPADALLAAVARANADLAAGRSGPAAWRERVLTGLHAHALEAGLRHHESHELPAPDARALAAFNAEAEEMLALAGPDPEWAELLAARAALACDDWPAFAALAALPPPDPHVPEAWAADAAADPPLVRLLVLARRLGESLQGRAGLAGCGAATFLADAGVPEGRALMGSVPTSVLAAPPPPAGPGRYHPALKAAVRQAAAAPAPAAGRPGTPLRKVPPGSASPTRKQQMLHAGHPGATPRSAALADQVRAHTMHGRFGEADLHGIGRSVSALKDGEARHVFRSLVRGGKTPDTAPEAAERLTQALRGHRNYRPDAPAPADVAARIAAWKEGDARVAGVLAMGRQQVPTRKGLAWAMGDGRKALDQLLAMPPKDAPGVSLDVERRRGQLAASYQGSLRTCREYTGKMDAQNAEARAAVIDMLRTDRPVQILARGLEKLGKGAQDSVAAALGFLLHLLAQKPNEQGAPAVTFAPEADERRPRVTYDAPGQATVTVSPLPNVAGVLHSLGHVLEANLPGVKALCNDFRNYRVGTEPFLDLGQFTDGLCLAGEFGAKDGWDKVWPDPVCRYAGKVNADQSTEVLAMGLEALWSDPVGLAADPEYLKLVLDILTGDLR